ncbi:tyrosine-type recombinase/integrase [Nostoc sp. MG11]|uniref:tyrosine-type recombinase/integrase n=1 Tax=Nostoc sp. MG11 TaxID=2721166 RepID=UPI001D02F0BD|nr:site-specific integrase [Nostoc sp. MG11]
MKINRFGRAEILSPDQINLLFTEGFVNPRDRALFDACLYAACRINEACTLAVKDVFGSNGVKGVLVLRCVNTKGKRDTREIQVHPKLRQYLEEYNPNRRKEFLFRGRHGLGHIHKVSADKILRDTCVRLDIEGVSTHSFRRTALTRMSDAGIPLRHIQEISGHRTLAALERYLGRKSIPMPITNAAAATAGAVTLATPAAAIPRPIIAKPPASGSSPPTTKFCSKSLSSIKSTEESVEFLSDSLMS